MLSPFFSIIIPTFNSERTLQGALDSILNQKYRDVEIVIVDGISKDSTVTLIKMNCSRDVRIRYVSEKDNGIYDAMNKGIEMASGQWVYFLGSNDSLYDDSVLEKVAGGIRDSDGQCDFFYGEVIMKGKRYDGQFTIEKLLTRNISHQAIFYRKQLFERMGRYNIRYRLHADWEFNIRYFLQFVDVAKYKNVLVANFGEGGVSSVHDVMFLREFLLPLKVQRLATTPNLFKKISKYDEWWRLIRNSGIRNYQELRLCVQGSEIPVTIQNMVAVQKLFTPQLLRIGVISKLIMSVSYMFNLVTKAK